MYPQGINNVDGPIKAFSLNSIDILDEQDKRVKRFVYLHDDGKLKVGERVRVFFYVHNQNVQNIKRL